MLTRDKARAAGLIKYHGNPCKRGAHTERYSCNGLCVQCERENHAFYRKGMTLGHIAGIRPMPDACECCGERGGVAGRGARNKALCADHNHDTGQFNGWLCVRCNSGIGQLGDSIERLEQAIAYLKRAQLHGC